MFTFIPEKPEDKVRNIQVTSFTIMTLNILFDASDISANTRGYSSTDLMHNDTRKKALYNLLRECNADIVALQEVTVEIFTDLTADAWYTCSLHPHTHHTSQSLSLIVIYLGFSKPTISQMLMVDV